MKDFVDVAHFTQLITAISTRCGVYNFVVVINSNVNKCELLILGREFDCGCYCHFRMNTCNVFSIRNPCGLVT
jgi:hypothetical protein